MLLNDLTEMTMRTGASIPALDNYDFNNLNNLDYTFIGKMQHGYSVFVCDHDSSLIYIVKDDNNTIITMTQLTKITIPNIGQVYEVSNSKTEQQYAGNMLNYKLKYFLVHHLGYKLLAGKVHSLSTEKVLQKLPQYFDMYMVNVKTGKKVTWNYNNYLKLSNIGKVTDWQVLLSSAHTPFNESMPNLPGFDNTRHFWTYANQLFEDCL